MFLQNRYMSPDKPDLRKLPHCRQYIRNLPRPIPMNQISLGSSRWAGVFEEDTKGEKTQDHFHTTEM